MFTACLTDVLESSSDDFESGDEVFEAVGGILQEVDASKEEDEIKDLCHQLIGLMKPTSANGDSGGGGGANRVLDAPVRYICVLFSIFLSYFLLLKTTKIGRNP